MSLSHTPGPRLGQILPPLLTAIGVTALLVFVGLELAFALAWAILVAAAVLARQTSPPIEEPNWPPAHKPFVVARGSEVSRLAWSFVVRTGAAGPTIVRRVRELARRRLAHRGIDIDDPAQFALADATLGEGVRAGLFQNHVHRTDIERALDAIERLPLTAESAGAAATQHPDLEQPAKED